MGTVAPVGMLEGYEEIANCVTLAGWAYDSSQPDRVLAIDILDGTTVLATVDADQLRQDLLTARKGDGKHSFAIPTPPTLKDGKPHAITFRITSTEIRLANGPKTVMCTS